MEDVELYAGELLGWDLNDSMAKDMEEALALLMGGLPSAPQRVVDDRRKMLIAIANGVIHHLSKRQEAFVITYNRDGVGPDTTTPDIHVRDGILP
jgi:hypothetical protein